MSSICDSEAIHLVAPHTCASRTHSSCRLSPASYRLSPAPSTLHPQSINKRRIDISYRALKKRFIRVTQMGPPQGSPWKEWSLYVLVAPVGVWLAVLMSLVILMVTALQAVEWVLRYVTMLGSRTTLRTYMGCTFTALPSNDDRLDFVICRGPTYIYGHTIGAVKNFCKWATGGFKELTLLSDAEVLSLLMTSPIARMWKVTYSREGRPVSMVLDMGDVTKGDVKATDISLGKGHYLCVERIDFDIETSDLSVTLVDSDGLARVVHRPMEEMCASPMASACSSSSISSADVSDEERLWNMAKAHLQGLIMWSIVSWSHNWVHFNLLDSAAALTPDVVPKRSVLRALLTPHLRFTPTINTAGPADGILNPQHAEDDTLKKFLPWKVQGQTAQQFLAKVAENCLQHYLKADETTGEKIVDPVAFPPEFVTDRLEPDNKLQGLLPYLDFLTEVYKAMEVYAQNLWVGEGSPHSERIIEHDIFMQWVRHIEQSVGSLKGLSKVDPVKLLATLLWTTVVHGADHDVCGRINTKWMMFGSAVPVDWDGEWQDVLKGSLFGTQLHAFRSSTFISCFGGYKNSWFTKGADLLVSPGLYNDWNSVPCEQTRCRLRAHHGTLLASLHGISKKWGWLSDVAGLPASVSF
eukprot:TRINITY_DN531_c0_g1_i11.p1 TRINITY_DN531_c0_g1~~TRINITY_DN531_c0_g1_i11.p1  ORF type:complete len:638 (+),score=149.43 TRINITY_DN531_c0_g1_i11:77-1990(+)